MVMQNWSRVVEMIEENRDATVHFLQDLVRAPSVTGKERLCSMVCKRKLEEIGLEIDTWDVDPDQLRAHPAFNDDIKFPPADFPISYSNRPNVVGIWDGSSSGRSLILNGHMDVVTPEPVSKWRHDPWGGEIVNGRLYGRGSLDMKGGMAAMIMALQSIFDSGLKPKGKVLIECVIGEESAVGNGTLSSLLRGYNADACVVTEPIGLGLCPAMRGGLYWRITIEGKPSHGIKKWEGIDALYLGARMLDALKSLEEELSRTESHPLYKQYPIAVPVTPDKIRAGVWKGVVAPECIIEGYFEPLPGRPIKHWEEAFYDYIKRVAIERLGLKGNLPSVEIIERYPSYEMPPEDRFVQTFKDSYFKALHSKPKITGANGGCDAAIRALYGGASTVIFGPDGGNAHGIDEFVNLDQVTECVKVLARVIMDWCGH